MALKVIPQQEFQKCFQQWQHIRVKCIVAHGEFFKTFSAFPTSYSTIELSEIAEVMMW